MNREREDTLGECIIVVVVGLIFLVGYIKHEHDAMQITPPRVRAPPFMLCLEEALSGDPLNHCNGVP